MAQKVTYGEGGFDPSKPNNNIIEVVEVEDEVVEESPTVTIPRAAVTKLAEDMQDSQINSIAEIKQAVLQFVQSVE